MVETTQKRKEGPSDSQGQTSYKKSKGGSAGRWKTPHHRVKMSEKVELGTTFHVGDQGIWVTFARGMRDKAIREFQTLCDEYGKTLYGIEAASKENNEFEREVSDDIEASIEAELESLKPEDKVRSRKVFTPVSTGIECLFFMKTMEPVEPGSFVKKICEDAQACSDPRNRKCKYINRLTPVFDTEKATENGIIKVARAVLSRTFDLKDEQTGDAKQVTESTNSNGAFPAYTYAIRHNIRNHTTFKSDEVITKIASHIDSRHKVNLNSPDKVILVEIFQLFCGISVVDGKEWTALKRYNLSALYDLTVPKAEDK